MFLLIEAINFLITKMKKDGVMFIHFGKPRLNFAFVSQYPNRPRVSVILYGEVLCKAFVSVFVFLAYFMHEIFTLKSL